MPEIKNNFLKGKMNKDLDERLLPPGEYRDALNIQISKSENSDTGVVQNVSGNALAHTSLSLTSSSAVIGSIPDEKNEYIIFFITDNNNHSIRLYDLNTNLVSLLATGDFLNFHKNSLITGVNLVEDLLFFTDDRNQPRKINVQTALNNSSYYNSEDLISVAKFSPYKAADIALSNQTSIKEDYIKEKFVRFSYRYKFEDNEFSTLAPFTQIAFKLENQALTSLEVNKISTSTFVENMVNHANQVLLTIPLPTYPNTKFGIKAIEVIIKDSNSAIAKIVDTIELGAADTADNKTFNNSDTTTRYKYKSTIPVKTLAEDQITRVFDAVPLTAKAQEVSGNRVIYGNFSQNIAFENINSTTFSENGLLPTIDYSVSISDKSSDAGDSAHPQYPHHSLKQRRKYDVGIVLSDKWGRKSPVILSDNSSVYFDAKDNSWDSNDWLGSNLQITFNHHPDDPDQEKAILNPYNATTNPHGWYSWRAVVKQTENDYYNVYLPGAGRIANDGYISLHGDNINKVPRSTDSSNETELSPSKVKLYPKLINGSFYSNTSLGIPEAFRPTVKKDGTIDVKRYSIKNSSSSAVTNAVKDIVAPFVYKGEVGATPYSYSYCEVTTNQIILDASPFGFVSSLKEIGTFTPYTSPENQVTNAIIYVNGVYRSESSSAISDSTAAIGGTGNGTSDMKITFTTPLVAGDKVDVLLVYKSDVAAGINSHVDSLVAPRTENASDITIGDPTNVPEASIIDPKVVTLASNNFENQMDLAKANYDVTEVNHKQDNGELIDVADIASVNLFGDFTDAIKGGPGVGLYDSENNPLMARLSKNKTDSSVFVDFSTSVNDLAVFETKPVESALDIYYETSTSGLVNELNSELTATALPTFSCSDASFAISDGTTGNTINSSDYSASAGTVTAVSPTTYTSGPDTYTATITVPSGYSNTGQSISCTDTATGSSSQTAFGCGNANFTVADGQIGAALSYSVSAGTVESVTPSTYQSGPYTYVPTIRVPSGYTNAGNLLTTCSDTATGSAIAFGCSHAQLTVQAGVIGTTVTGSVSNGASITGSFNPSTYQSGPTTYQAQIISPNNSTLWTNPNTNIGYCTSNSVTGITSTTPLSVTASPTTIGFAQSTSSTLTVSHQTGVAITHSISYSDSGGWGSLNQNPNSSVSPTNVTFTTLAANPTSASRTATITFTRGSETASVTITQSGATESVSFTGFTQFASSSAAAQTSTISQSGSGTLSLSSMPSWVRINGSTSPTFNQSAASQTMSVTVLDHTSSGVRSGQIILAKGSATHSETISQAGAQAATSASVSPTTFVINQGTSSTHTFNITANGLWAIHVAGSNPPYSVSPSSGSGNYTGLTISYTGATVTKNGQIHVIPPLDANTHLATVEMDAGF